MGNGPLSGVKVLEFAGIGPGPFCGMLLADMGAEVIRIDRKGGRGGSKYDISSRGKKSIALDLKNPKPSSLHQAHRSATSAEVPHADEPLLV